MSHNKVIFRESDHKYFYKSEEYKSVSKTCSIVFEQFDSKAISEKLALKSGLDPQHYIDSWDNTRQRGTDFHKIKEEEYLEKDYEIFRGHKYKVHNPDKTHDNESLVENLIDLEDGMYTELLVFDHRYKIAGQVDRAYIRTDEDGKRYFGLQDWKTDNKIQKRGYNNRKMKFPLLFLQDCNYNRYAIKMSMYMFMMDHAGYEFDFSIINHVKIDDDFNIISQKDYELPYRGWEINKILTTYYLDNSL